MKKLFEREGKPRLTELHPIKQGLKLHCTIYTDEELMDLQSYIQ